MPLQLIEVENKKQLRASIMFQIKLYEACAQYVPPIIMDELKMLGRENPAHSFSKVKSFIVKDDQKIVGRITLIHNQNYPDTLRFGWLDFIDNKEVSDLLFDKAEEWAKKLGCSQLKGPVGFTNFDKVGMLTEGFDQLSNMVTIYNYAYYPEHLRAFGFEAKENWVEFRIPVVNELPEKIARISTLTKKRYGVKLKILKTKRDLRKFVDNFFYLLDESYRELPDYVPFTSAQKEFYIEHFIGLIPPEYVCGVQDKDDNPIAFGLTAPSLVPGLKKAGGKLFPFGWWHLLQALRRPHSVELLLIGVLPKWQNKGIPGLIIDQLAQVFIRKEIQYVEVNPELENNHKIQALWKSFKATQNKKRTIFNKKIS